jgi:hypothetical protein
VPLYVTGLNDRGCATVVKTENLDSASIGSAPKKTELWRWERLPDGVTTPVMDVGCAPGDILWRVLRWPAGTAHGMHRSETIDFHSVLFGTIELLLEGSSIKLSASDCAVVTGVMHGWRVGEDGCVMSTTNIGVSSPDGSKP